jgi:gamma-glutamyltranspeptidase/glutathione hydrolase
MPPPSSGGVAMLQVFGLLERLGIVPTADGAAATSRTAGPHAPVYAHLLIESFKHAFADRARWLADPAFVEVPVAELLAPAYLDASAAAISPTRTRSPLAYGRHAPPPEDGGTSHVSVIDASGMGVACTETINLEFGSLLAVPGFGFVLNDEMDDFTTRPDETNAFGLRQSARNLPEPGKRPLSSMSPTIVLRDGRAVLVVGGSGGPRIITGTTQVILNNLLFAMSPRAAVSAPRLHHQWLPDVLRFEERWTNEPTLEALRALGHETASQQAVSVVQLVERTPDGIAAASDPRKGGQPAGH